MAAKTKKIEFSLPNTQNPFLSEGNLPLRKSVRERTSFPLQKFRGTEYSLFYPMVAKVLRRDSALNNWMLLQPGTGILSGTKMTQFIIRA